LIETPACGYASNAWSLTSVSADNPAMVTSFNTISPTGLYSAGPFANSLAQGSYGISINSVSLNVHGTSVKYTAFTGVQSFILTVSSTGLQNIDLTPYNTQVNQTYTVGQTNSAISLL
jgi:hypothetical protein